MRKVYNSSSMGQFLVTHIGIGIGNNIFDMDYIYNSLLITDVLPITIL